MERRRQRNVVKWYENLPTRNWKANMTPNVSRSSSRISRIGGLNSSFNESDFEARVTSGSSKYGYKQGRLMTQRTLDDILSNNPETRPKSVSLAKYEPLPAINSDIPRKKQYSSASSISGTEKSSKGPNRSSSVGALGLLQSPVRRLSPARHRSRRPSDNVNDNVLTDQNQENETLMYESSNWNRMDNEEYEIILDSSETGKRPPLLRSRTFEVLETNLLNLPVIEDSNEESPDEEDARERVKVNIDGISLPMYVSHSAERASQSNSIRRNSSSVSLITHPGTPDSGSAATSATFSGKSHDTYKRAWRSQESSDSSSEDEDTEYRISVVLPNGTQRKYFLNVNTTLNEFLTFLSSLISNHRLIIADKVEEIYLNDSIKRLGFSEVETIQLIPDK